MGKKTRISWTDHTFNSWHGCQKVSPACDSCYAESLSNRWGHHLWGRGARRRFMSKNYWKQPFKWDREAARAGKPALVFCASMADVFEARGDLDGARRSLWELIERTPNLRWMLLTKRPENIKTMIPERWLSRPKDNVWLGVTAENQRRADERIPILRRIPCVLRWVSAEPLLEMIDFRTYFPGRCNCDARGIADCVCFIRPGIEWIITGGESGGKARRMAPRWAHDIRQQCADAGVKYHFKQTGAVLARELQLNNVAGKDSSEWPAGYNVQEFPTG